MQIFQAFKFQLMPNGKQKRDMHLFAGSCRFVFNKALAMQIANYKAGGKFISYNSMSGLLTSWRNNPETPWLKDSPVHAQQSALKDVERAYKNFFEKRAKFPNFKRKGSSQSYRQPDQKTFEVDQPNNRIKLPKLGWIRYRGGRDIPGKAKNVTVSYSGGRWFISIMAERQVAEPIPVSTSAIGIDLGIARFATLSDGSFIAPLNSFKTNQRKLAKYQKRMSRKVKFSNNWKKAKARVAKLHLHIANARKDFLHKSSSEITKNHALICIENLKVGNMSSSASGTILKPGKRVAQKRGLNRSILDQGWFEFRRQLEYKSVWNGGILIAVPAQYTSQTCPSCGHIAKENRLTQAQFACVSCGYENNADVVGAINVLERGQRLLACGEDGSGLIRKKKSQPASLKQEPAEAIICELAHV